jgi:hypothetical protein
MGRAEGHFTRCADLLKRVPVFALGRSWGFATFAQDAAALERHFLDRDEALPPE